MRKIVLLKFLLILAIAGQAWAQARTVTGRVTGPDGEGLPGVTVVERGTTNGMSTGLNGAYSLVVPETAVLVFSFIGFNTQEIPVAGRSEINVRMSADQRQLSEVVVTGYGTQERRELTGSIASIKGESIANLATPSFDQQLAGRAPGVQVTVPSGVLGQAPRIRIRGTNSISSGADPLIVIDGVPVITGDQSGVAATNPLADINPADIESFEVLKDGSATAIYGSRAANGVILITTKRGKVGPASVRYDTYVGTNREVGRLDLLNAEEFVMIANEKFTNRNQPAPAVLGNERTDWHQSGG
jgi:TonB-dependent SusC/RagA subfamily outer membrane receptor